MNNLTESLENKKSIIANKLKAAEERDQRAAEERARRNQVVVNNSQQHQNAVEEIKEELVNLVKDEVKNRIEQAMKPIDKIEVKRLKKVKASSLNPNPSLESLENLQQQDESIQAQIESNAPEIQNAP